jgi:hypothetical protein
MDRAKLLNRLENAWNDLQASYAGLAEGYLDEPGVTDEWSIKDILAHVTVWEEEALKHLPHIAEGGRPSRYSVTYGGIDAFNALKTQENRRLTTTQVLARHRAIHQQLIDYIHTVPEDYFATETRFRRRLRLDTYSHYPIHTQAIVAWRSRRAA